MSSTKKGKEKEQVILKCFVDNPDAIVKWYKENNQIESSNSFRIKKDASSRSLTITKAELTHSGRYTCKIVGFEKEGEAETSCDVEIEGAVYTLNIE